MKAAVFTEKNKIEYKTDVKTPEIGEGEALVKVAFAGICGSDVHVWKGEHPTATFPRIPGHEFSGVLVEAKGKLKDGLCIGDNVVVQPIWSCGTCSACIKGRDNVCNHLGVFGVHADGCFAEYIRVPLKKVYRLPESVSLKMGALTEPLAVAVHDVRRSGLKVGQKTLIIGGGPIGLIIGLVAKLAGAEVYVSEINEFRLKFAKELGLNTINPAKEDIMKRTGEITGDGFDVVFEVSGSKPGIETTTRVIKTCGTIMLVGMSSALFPIDTGAVFAKELEIKGVRIHSQENFEGAINILQSGIIEKELKKLITKEFPLNKCVEAMHYQDEDAEHFKVLIEI